MERLGVASVLAVLGLVADHAAAGGASLFGLACIHASVC